MRYFLITFNLKNIASLGNIAFENDTFPSKKLIDGLIFLERNIPDEIIILNIFEFKNKEDYNNFNK